MRAQIVSFHCVLKDELGHVLSSSFSKDVINQREDGNDRLGGLVVGEKRRIAVPAHRAYGSYDPALVIELKPYELEDVGPLAVGAQLLQRVGNQEKRIFKVTELSADRVVLDANHPLAGHDLVFEVEIVSAREARADDYVEEPVLGSGAFLH